MRLVRFRAGGGAARVGVLEADMIAPLTGADTLAALLALPGPRTRELCLAPGPDAVPLAAVDLLAPVDGRTEVWAAGVTYERSRDARVLESEHEATVYERFLAAERPEIFFKSASWRVVGTGR